MNGRKTKPGSRKIADKLVREVEEFRKQDEERQRQRRVEKEKRRAINEALKNKRRKRA
jgi:hypothetical protein